jgi:uncharacterized protein (DUF924 family)
MSLASRRVSFVDDRHEMLALLRRNFGASQEQRFDWRHTSNPAGPAWSWFVYDKRTLGTVALATVFPRNMYVDGKRVVGGQVGEFAVEAGYRSLGPALLMQRTTFEPVDHGSLAFCYDCPPHDQGMSTFIRLGMRANAEVYRYAYPLRSEKNIEKRFGRHWWTNALIATINLGLRVRAARWRTPNLEISSYHGRFGDEFSALDKSLSSAGSIRGSRSAEDLNWRYCEDPLSSNCLPTGTRGRYEVLVARRAGEVVAFVVLFIQSDGIASLVDLFGHELPNAGAALLDAVVQICNARKVSSIHAFCSEASELRGLLMGLGFRRRERDSRVVAYARPEDRIGKLVHSGQRWTFNQVEVML